MLFSTFVCLTLLAALSWRLYRQLRARNLARAAMLDECGPLLEAPRRSASAAGFARLQGRRAGYRVHLALEEDHAAMRKVPSLWLHVSVVGCPLSGAGWLDILQRPMNTEFFSPSWDWDRRLDGLPGWPEEAVCRTRDHPPDLYAIDGEVRKLFEDSRTKELVVTPQKVRITYQAKQAQRGDYLLLRSSVFDEDPVPGAQVEQLVGSALRIRRSLEAAGVNR